MFLQPQLEGHPGCQGENRCETVTVYQGWGAQRRPQVAGRRSPEGQAACRQFLHAKSYRQRVSSARARLRRRCLRRQYSF